MTKGHSRDRWWKHQSPAQNGLGCKVPPTEGRGSTMGGMFCCGLMGTIGMGLDRSRVLCRQITETSQVDNQTDLMNKE